MAGPPRHRFLLRFRLDNRPTFGWVSCLAVVFALLVCPFEGRSQTPDFTVFGKAQGLNCNYIRQIARDDAGFFWLVTNRGLFRFDGANFLLVLATEGDPNEILRMRIYDDRIYLMYANLGVIDTLNVKSLAHGSFMPGAYTDILQVNDSDFVGYERSGSLTYIQKGKITHSRPVAESSDGILALWNNSIFLHLKANKLLCLNSTTLELVKDFRIPEFNFVRGDFQSDNNRLILNMNGAIYAIDRSLELHEVAPKKEGRYSTIHSYAYIDNRLQYFIRDDRELVISQGDITTRIVFPVKEVKELWTLYPVDSANFLIGTNGFLIHFRSRPPSVTSIGADDQLFMKNSRIRRNIIPVNERLTVLAGLPGIIRWTGPILSVADRFQQVYFSDATLLGKVIYGVGEGRYLTWWNSENGQNGEIGFSDLKSSVKLVSVCADPLKNRILVAGQGGVFAFDPITHNLDQVTELDDETVILIRKTSTGDWLLGTDHGIIVLDPRFREKRRINTQTPGLHLANERINEIREVAPNKFWIGHEGGAELIDVREEVVADSIPTHLLSDRRVATILKDSLGRIWFATFDGILGYEPGSGLHIRLGERAGLVNREFNRRSAAVLPDGRFVFGGIGGYDIINPYMFSFSKATKRGVISAVEWSTEDGTIRQSVHLRPDEQLTFDVEKESIRLFLSTADMLETSACDFQFRINQGNWKALDGKTFLDIYKLTPGTYIIEFRGSNPYGALIVFEPVTLVAHVVFYKSLVFLIFILCACLLSVMGMIFLRYNQRRELRLKEGIAMDLHDEVGTTLNRALMVSRAPGFAQKEEKVQDYLSEAIFSLRTYVRTMRDKYLDIEQFLIEIHEVLHSRLEYSGITYDLVRQEIVPGTYAASVSRDIRLSLYEVINNVLKHAKATHVKLTIWATQEKIRLEVVDNGKLRSIDELFQHGNGLKNIEARVIRNDGLVRLQVGENGHGLCVFLEFKNQNL